MNKTAKSTQKQNQLQTKLSRSEFAETLADQKCFHAYSSTAQCTSHVIVTVKALVGYDKAIGYAQHSVINDGIQ